MKVKCNVVVWSNVIFLTEISNLIHLSDEAVKRNIVILKYFFLYFATSFRLTCYPETLSHQFLEHQKLLTKI